MTNFLNTSYQNVLIGFVCCVPLLTTPPSVAQSRLAAYENSYLGKTFDIEIRPLEKNLNAVLDKNIFVLMDKSRYILQIHANSLDEVFDQGGITVKEKQLADFRKSIETAKGKYESWVKTAKENNVHEFYKDMGINSPRVGAFFKWTNWESVEATNLTFRFSVEEKKGITKYLLRILTPNLASDNNAFVKVDGFSLIFSSVEEIDMFLAALDSGKAEKFISDVKSKDLFKE